MKTRVLVCGASGFIGKALMNRLSRLPELELIRLSLKSVAPSLWSSTLDQLPPIDRVVNLMGISSVGQCQEQPQLAESVNGDLPLLLEQRLRLKNPDFQMIQMSTGTIYQASKELLTETSPIEPQSHYARTKRLAEIKLLDWSQSQPTNILIFRLFNHTHQSQSPLFFMPTVYSQLKAFKEQTPPHRLLTGNLKLIRDIGALQDLIDLLELVLTTKTSGCEIYNVASGTGKSLEDLVKELIRRMDLQVEIQEDPQRLRPGEPPSIVASIQKVCEKFNWQPQRSKTVSDLVIAFLSPH